MVSLSAAELMVYFKGGMVQSGFRMQTFTDNLSDKTIVREKRDERKKK